ncbi:MAG: hypothetical protein K8S27_00145 [Candidatus Omnitrophica bacterium]|nr:hypothetical protein [Candidatus Omnitrophota bacterium]
MYRLIIHEREDKLFFRFYLWLLILVGCFHLVDNPLEFSLINNVSYGVYCISLLAFALYAFEIKLFHKEFWRMFFVFYVTWEIISYFFLFAESFGDNVFIFLMRLPKYWGVLFYTYEMMEDSPRQGDIFYVVKNKIIEKGQPVLKTLYHIFNAFLFLVVLMLAIVVLHDTLDTDNVIFLFYFVFIAFFYFLYPRIGYVRSWQIQIMATFTGYVILNVYLEHVR